jgi:signal transduction histidine kinase
MQASQRRLLQQALQQGQSWQGEVTLTGRNGRLYEADLAAAPVRGTAGDRIGFVFSHQDISHLKELEQARQQFMVNVSHQLRTPVTNIKLYTDLLRMEPMQGDKRAHYLKVLAAQTERLEHLVQDILEMTALDGGRGLLTWEPLRVEPLIETVGARYRAQAAEQALELTVRLPSTPLPPVQGDQNRLIQALSELLRNALTFTPAGGRIALAARLEQRQGREFVAIDVQDNGPGVPAAEREQIFERFYRGREAADGSVNGSGLGLSIVREIMHLHGGMVTVRSRAEAGSRFTLWLPALARHTLPASDADDEIV